MLLGTFDPWMVLVYNFDQIRVSAKVAKVPLTVRNDRVLFHLLIVVFHVIFYCELVLKLAVHLAHEIGFLVGHQWRIEVPFGRAIGV